VRLGGVRAHGAELCEGMLVERELVQDE
jgi:hypothetical protein